MKQLEEVQLQEVQPRYYSAAYSVDFFHFSSKVIRAFLASTDWKTRPLMRDHDPITALFMNASSS